MQKSPLQIIQENNIEEKVHSPQESIPLDQDKKSETIKSEFLKSYMNYLSDSLPLPSGSQLQKLFAKEGISYYSALQENKENRDAKCQYYCQRDIWLNNSEMMTFSIQVSRFCLKLTLLNIKGDNPLLKYKQSRCGNFGRVYYCTFFDEDIALKILPFTDLVHMSYYINKAMKEYAIMKICSGLGCAPYLNNSLGFDLIVYDDSVMFSMEKCTQIEQMQKATMRNLKYDLKLMHHHQIIHFDIKPENIMFSPHFMKPVFIDFGFTEIVQQKLGEKTLTMFRGSPAFCGEEMAKILGEDECLSAIDVYFNDLHCLKLSIKQICLQTSTNHSHIDDLDIEDSDMMLEQQIQINLMIFLLKHKFLTHRTEGIIKLLKYKDCLLMKQSQSEVLRLFEKSVPSHMFEHIYGSLERDFNKYLDQSTIQSFYKYRQRTFAVWKPSSDQANEQKQESTFAHRFDADYKEPTSTHMDQYKEFLEMENIFCNPNFEEQSKYILIEALRLDRKNLSPSEKIILSNKFNAANGVQSQLSLSSIKTTFRLLFEYCLALPRTNWKKQQIFVVLTQILMLDMNLEPWLQQFFSVLLELHKTIMNEIRCSIQLSKFIYLETFKHLSEHECMRKTIPQKIYAFGKQIMKKVKSLHANSENESIRYIISALEPNTSSRRGKRNPSDYYGIMKQLSLIHDSGFKQDLLEFLYLQSLQIYRFSQKHESAYQSIQQTKEFTLYQLFKSNKGCFHYSAYHLTRILAIMNNNKELHLLLRDIIEAINCVEVSSKFKFQMCIFIFSSDLNTQKMKRFCLELLEYPQILVTIKLNAQLAEMLDNKLIFPLFFAPYFLLT